MCEIAILDAEKYSVGEIEDISLQLYRSMGSSLGVMSLKDTDDGIVTEAYKAVNPDPMELHSFVKETKECDKYIIHGRLATHGAVDYTNAHPLHMDCDCCDVDYLFHNGIVSGSRSIRANLEDEGHTFTTGTDSEVLAHAAGGVPGDFDEIPPNRMFDQPAIIMVNKERFFVTVSNGYTLSGTGEMARNHRQFAPDVDEDYRSVIMTSSAFAEKEE